MKIKMFKNIVESLIREESFVFKNIEWAENWEKTKKSSYLNDFTNETISFRYLENNKYKIISFPNTLFEDYDVNSEELRNKIRCILSK